MVSHQLFSLTNLNLAPPGRKKLAALALLVLTVHLWLLISSGDSLWRLHSESQKLGPLQTRVVAPLLPATAAPSKAAPENHQPPLKKPLPKPLPKPIPAPISNPTAEPAGISAVASAALPEPVIAPETTPEPAPELAPQKAPETTAVATEPAEVTPAQIAQDKALVAKAENFPDNLQINYKLTGQERGLNYFATGYLKWQAKPASSSPRNYEAELRVRAFLIGNRVWRSQGLLTEEGLAPKRYSDSFRGERAAHFDSVQRTISFSGNTPSTSMQPGAQDQVSLFIQMAAAVSAQNFKTGSELNIQTATTRDAVNWRLTYQSDEAIEVKGERIETQKWVCLPRGKFDSRIEMWLSKTHGGLPVRIKITQVSGNFIDMEMSGTEVPGPLTE